MRLLFMAKYDKIGQETYMLIGETNVILAFRRMHRENPIACKSHDLQDVMMMCGIRSKIKK